MVKGAKRKYTKGYAIEGQMRSVKSWPPFLKNINYTR